VLSHWQEGSELPCCLVHGMRSGNAAEPFEHDHLIATSAAIGLSTDRRHSHERLLSGLVQDEGTDRRGLGARPKAYVRDSAHAGQQSHDSAGADQPARH
jgi:hypothetical protein